LAPKILTAFRLDAELIDTLDQTAERLSLKSGDGYGPSWNRTDALRYLIRQGLDQLRAGREASDTPLPRTLPRLAAADWVKAMEEKRADALIRKVSEFPGAKVKGEVTRESVLRLALLRGLEQLEQETGKRAHDTPSPSREAPREAWQLECLLPEKDDILARGLDEASAQLGDEPGGKSAKWDRAKTMRYFVWQGLARMGITYESLTIRRKKGSTAAASRGRKKRR